MATDPLVQALASMPTSAWMQRKRRDPWEAKQAYADALLKAGASGAPVSGWGEGLARVGQGLAGGLFGSWYENQEKTQEEEKRKILTDALATGDVSKITEAASKHPDLAELAIKLRFADIMDQRQKQQAGEVYRTMRGASGGGDPPQGTGPTGPGAPSTIDPNNIGNIRDMQRGGFRSFATPEEGVAEAIRLVQKYPDAFNGGKPMTLLQVGERWAPRGDGNNDPAQWAKNIASVSGLPLDQPLDFRDPNVAAAFAQGLHRAEKGASFGPDVYQRGVQMAFGGAPAPQTGAPSGAPSIGAAPLPNVSRETAPSTPEIGSQTGGWADVLARFNPIGSAQAAPPSASPTPAGIPPTMQPPTAGPVTVPLGSGPIPASAIPYQPGTPSGAPLTVLGLPPPQTQAQPPAPPPPPPSAPPERIVIGPDGKPQVTRDQQTPPVPPSAAIPPPQPPNVAGTPVAPPMMGQPQAPAPMQPYQQRPNPFIEPAQRAYAAADGLYRQGRPQEAMEMLKQAQAYELKAQEHAAAEAKAAQDFELKRREDARKEADTTREAGKTRVEDAKARQSAELAIDSMERLRGLTQGLIGDKALDSAAGLWQSRLPTVRQQTADVEAKLENLKGRIALETLQAMKAASANGASGFGALSQKELAALENAIGSLDLRQDPETLKRQLREIDSRVSRILEITRQGYASAYGGAPIPGGGQPSAAPPASGGPALPPGFQLVR